jgi:hypothetical protein
MSQTIEFLDFDPDELNNEGYYEAMRADITDAHNVGSFIVGQETKGDNNRTIEVRDLTPNPQKLNVHVGNHT